MTNTKRITIIDVAKAAGVSTGTASRVLNQREGEIKISEQTRTLVIETARKLGYHPNPFASALRTQRTGVIGVILRDICDPFLTLLAREVQKAARVQGMNLLFAHAEYDLELVGRQIAYMHSQLFDGLLLLGDIPGDIEIVDELVKSNTPFVAVARGLGTRLPMVNIDEKAGIYLGIDYLRGLGHKRIAFIGNMLHGGVKERSSHFQNYFREHKLVLNDAYMQLCGNSRSDALACAQDLMALPQPPTAIFCATDLAAYGALSGIERAGLSIPEKVSILGFDDIEGSAETYPALTTIRQPVDEMATSAVSLLMSLIENTAPEEDEPPRTLIKPQLIERQSCAPPEI
jgi:LacI family repressor for deo operon, udp, cdd, tsx, nupC, and nupG